MVFLKDAEPENFWSRFLSLWCWALTICWLGLVAQSFILSALLHGQEGAIVVREDFNPTFVTAVLIGPLVEELLFRGWVSSRVRMALLGCGTLLFWGLCTVFFPGVAGGAATDVCLLVLSGLGMITYLLDCDEGLSEGGPVPWLAGIFAVVVFALVHLSNYSTLDIAWYVKGLVVVPQFLLGMFALLARIRLGFLAAVALHMVYNLEVLFFSGDLGVYPVVFVSTVLVCLFLFRIFIVGRDIYRRIF